MIKYSVLTQHLKITILILFVKKNIYLTQSTKNYFPSHKKLLRYLVKFKIQFNCLKFNIIKLPSLRSLHPLLKLTHLTGCISKTLNKSAKKANKFVFIDLQKRNQYFKYTYLI